MVKWLYKILFVAIGMSFFISATEMDLGEAHNTFFDEYDTYLKTEQVAVSLDQAYQRQELTGLLTFSYPYHPLPVPCLRTAANVPICCGVSPARLFLRNSVWRI
ncbi:hypothetical protein [Sediminibacterium soli]|uniref:hypothetical protein n=1 Tax=Sediminibacterium soli TaxID=2698829 RepID=UPI001379E73C|nr:hypothetical protein [Sediminibacterium soli]NCI47419.1 hypothetical protein [Sediminibacterium soli]